MKVAFDATVLHGRKSGVGYYCQELFKNIALIDRDTEYFVFSHQPVQLDLPAENKNIRYSSSLFCPIRAFYLHALLPQLLAKEKPDVCHYTNFLAPIADDTPYIVTIHDMGLERMRSAHPIAKRLYTRRLVPRVAQRARLVITNSEYSKWEIVRYLGIRPDRIRVTPLAASAEFQPVSQNDRAPIQRQYGLTAPYILYVGNLEPRKNLSRLLEAFARLSNKEYELVIVGNRWYRGDDAATAAGNLGIANRVRFLGYVPREHLPSIYSGATAFVYPSLLEGFGLPVIEAMACGTPVITSDNTSLKEIAGDAALLVDPTNTRSLQQALMDVIDDPGLRTDLSLRGLRRASQYSWENTAALTLEAYQSVVGPEGRHNVAPAVRPGLATSFSFSVQRTLEYAAMFQYPLKVEELHERLFDTKLDIESFKKLCAPLPLPRAGDFISPDPDFVSMRHFRETISDRSIEAAWPHLVTLSRIPFIRMIAFSGATAHRNMTNNEDVDLFMIVEDGKLWAAFLIAMVWAKLKGLRARLCMNYVITDRALPLLEQDAFTAQQAASLKPIFGKSMYDAFIESNPFVTERFPNFKPQGHRSFHPEIKSSRVKAMAEFVLRCGPIQILERVSRRLLGRYLQGKANGAVDVLLEPRRLKLHMHSHKGEVLASNALTGAFAKTAK